GGRDAGEVHRLARGVEAAGGDADRQPGGFEVQRVDAAAAVEVDGTVAEQGRAVGQADRQGVVARAAVEGERGEVAQGDRTAAVEDVGHRADRAAAGAGQDQGVVARGAVDHRVAADADRAGGTDRGAVVADPDLEGQAGRGGGVGVRTEHVEAA